MQATAPIVQKNGHGLEVMWVWSKIFTCTMPQPYIMPPQPAASFYAHAMAKSEAETETNRVDLML